MTSFFKNIITKDLYSVILLKIDLLRAVNVSTVVSRNKTFRLTHIEKLLSYLNVISVLI